DQTAKVDVRLHPDRFADVAARTAHGVLAEGQADHVGQDVGTATGSLLDPALEQAGGLPRGADARGGGGEGPPARSALAAGPQVTAQEDEPSPGKATVTGNLLGAEQEAADALPGPFGPALGGGRLQQVGGEPDGGPKRLAGKGRLPARRPLPQRDANG